MTAPETPDELRARLDALVVCRCFGMDGCDEEGDPGCAHCREIDCEWPCPAEEFDEMRPAIDALLAENVQLRQLADLFRFNFSPWLIHNAPDLYRAIWGEW